MAAGIKKVLNYSQEVKQQSILFSGGQRQITLCNTVFEKKMTFSIYVIQFSKKMTFSIYAKIQDGSRNSEKSQFFRGPTRVIFSTHRVQNLPKITVSLMVTR